MKKILLACFLGLSLFSLAQEPLVLQPMVKDSLKPKKDTSWKISGFFGLNFSQTSQSNWQGGMNFTAINSISISRQLIKKASNNGPISWMHNTASLSLALEMGFLSARTSTSSLHFQNTK